MRLPDFMELEPYQYQMAKAEWLEHEGIKEQKAWERARWQAFKTTAPPKGRGGMVKLTDYEVFPWEKKDEAPPSTRKRFEQLKRKWQ